MLLIFCNLIKFKDKDDQKEFEYRNLAIECGIVTQLSSFIRPNLSNTVLRNISSTVAMLHLNNKDTELPLKLQVILPLIRFLLYSRDETVLENVCSTVDHLTTSDKMINSVIQNGKFKKF